MVGWVGGTVEDGGGERMNVSRRDGIRWPPGLTAAPLSITARGLELQPVFEGVCMCVCEFTLAATLLSSAPNRVWLSLSRVYHYLGLGRVLIVTKLICFSVLLSNTLKHVRTHTHTHTRAREHTQG